MKAILEFNLPDEKPEFNRANKAGAYYCALWDFSMFLREKLKYAELSESDRAFYEFIREEFNNCTGDLLND